MIVVRLLNRLETSHSCWLRVPGLEINWLQIMIAALKISWTISTLPLLTLQPRPKNTLHRC